MRKIITTAAVAVAALFVTATPASAADLVERDSVDSTSVRNGSLYQQDINPNVVNVFRTPMAGVVSSWNVRDGGIYDQDLHSSAKVGRVSGVEADSPYPSATQLDEGANSTAKWVGDEGATLQRAWVQCAPGKVAIGGGYQRADEAVATFKAIQVVTSSATQIEGGSEVYQPIAGDADGSVLPNAWLVEGFNNSSTDLILRPSVICASVS